MADTPSTIIAKSASRLAKLDLQRSLALKNNPTRGETVPGSVIALRKELESLLNDPKGLNSVIQKKTVEKDGSLYALDSVKHRVLCSHWKRMAQGLPVNDIVAKFADTYEGGEEVCRHCGHIFSAGKRVAATTFTDDGNALRLGREVWREVTPVSLPVGPIYDILLSLIHI